MRTSRDIIEDINRFKPENEDWLKLDDLLNELWEMGNQENYTSDLLQIFERFPAEDGAGVFWSIVHGIERFKDYETELIYSLKRQPSDMGLLMIKRIMNTGAKTVGGIEISKVIDDLLSRGQMTSTQRDNLVKIRE